MTQPDPNQPPERATAVQTPDETSVRFSIDVEAPIEHAFQVFTEGIDTWWPREHHIGKVDMAMAILEPRAGGRWYELGIDESECDWGMVLAWEPPRHVALSWHVDGDFRPDTEGSRVDIRFEALGDHTTRVVLEHSGLDRHGPTWRRLRDGISRGWPADLQRFAQAVEHATVASPVRPVPTMIDTDAGGGAIGGGIGEPQRNTDPGGTKIYVRVDNMQAYLDRAEQLGGRTVVAPTPLPGDFGSFAVLADPDGQLVGLWA